VKREFHANFAFALQDSPIQAYALDWLVRKSLRLPHRWQEVGAIQDDFARVKILAQAIITGHKESARMGTRRNPTGLYYWIQKKSAEFLHRRKEFIQRVIPLSPLNLSLFPPGSWAIQVRFTLSKPYLSKDDVDFYILDNPVKKEWVFKVPYVAPSQWKGALRAAMTRILVEERPEPKEFARRRFRLTLLFGDEKGEEPGAIKGLAQFLDQTGGKESARIYRNLVRAHFGIPSDKPMPHFQGRLYFYPTFFDRIGLEVINPHPRETGAGKQPIYFESVPADTPGVFTLLYVPLALVGKASQEEMEREAEEDLAAVAQGVRAMLTKYGFGAKTSSGYGVAEINEFLTRRHGEHGG